MPYCTITQVSSPSSTSAYDPGDTITVTWNNNGMCSGGLGSWVVNEIKLQYYDGNSWNDISTLYSGAVSVTTGSKQVTLANSYANYGDAYRLRMKYQDAVE
tara:strand:+ start:9767 stop:10069 length:303 start_codon:yes stop_codon:yes gene_type:complete